MGSGAAKLLGPVAPGGHADDRHAMGAGGRDVARRVAHDERVAGIERPPEPARAAVEGGADEQLAGLPVVGEAGDGVRAPLEEAVDAAPGQLEARALGDVAGAEPHRRAGRREIREHLHHARQHAKARPLDLLAQRHHVALEDPVAEGVLEGPPQRDQDLPDDEPVGHPVEPEPGEGMLHTAELPGQDPLERSAPGAGGVDEGSVHVEEDHPALHAPCPRRRAHPRTPPGRRRAGRRPSPRRPRSEPGCGARRRCR